MNPNRDSELWSEFCDELRSAVPQLRSKDLKASTSLRDLANGDRLLRATIVGHLYGAGLQMPDDLLRSIETLGEAFDWVRQRQESGHSQTERAEGPNETARLRLRLVGQRDVAALYSGIVDPEFSFRWRYRGSSATVQQFSEDLFDGSTFAQFVVERKEDGLILGLVQAYNPRMDAGTCSFAFTRASGDLTPISEMVAGLYLFISYLFRSFAFRKLYAEVPGFNWSQFASGEGVFFSKEGCLKEYDYYADRYWDLHVIAIARDEWRKVEDHWDPILK